MVDRVPFFDELVDFRTELRPTIDIFQNQLIGASVDSLDPADWLHRQITLSGRYYEILVHTVQPRFVFKHWLGCFDVKHQIFKVNACCWQVKNVNVRGIVFLPIALYGWTLGPDASYRCKLVNKTPLKPVVNVVWLCSSELNERVDHNWSIIELPNEILS